MIGRVYQAISGCRRTGRGRHRQEAAHTQDNYLYRSIDDVLGALAPLLARHRLCILPRVLERSAAERVDASGALVMHVALKVAFDLVSAEDGSAHTIEAYGEAIDEGDKGTAKAMQSAYKYAVLQAFCVPALAGEDADARSHKLTPVLRSEPAEGWAAWCALLRDEIAACAAQAALRSLQQARRDDLAALSREQPALCRDIGTAFAERQAVLAGAEHDAATASAAGEPEGRDTGRLRSLQRQRRSAHERASALARTDPRRPQPQRLVRRGRRKRTVRMRSAPISSRLPDRLTRDRTKPGSRRDCPAHRAWVRGHHCCVPSCLDRHIECAHVRSGTDGGTALKPSDRWSVSLCRIHHAEQHRIGERAFEAKHALDLKALAERFAATSPHRHRI